MGSPVLLFVGVGLDVLAALFHIVATSTNSWACYEETSVKSTVGLWKLCDTASSVNTCSDIKSCNVPGAFHFSRFAMITSMLVAAGALVIPLLVSFKKLPKKFLKVYAGIVIGRAVLALSGTISVAAYMGENLPVYRSGYSIILAWLSVPITIAGGVLTLLGGLDTPVKFMEKDM